VIGRGKVVAVSGREEAKNAQIWLYEIIDRKHYHFSKI
jgi:hypothetical protein